MGSLPDSCPRRVPPPTSPARSRRRSRGEPPPAPRRDPLRLRSGPNTSPAAATGRPRPAAPSYRAARSCPRRASPPLARPGPPSTLLFPSLRGLLAVAFFLSSFLSSFSLLLFSAPPHFFFYFPSAAAAVGEMGEGTAICMWACTVQRKTNCEDEDVCLGSARRDGAPWAARTRCFL